MKKQRTLFLCISFFFLLGNSFAQDDLLEEIDTDTESNYTSAAFKSLKIINLQSTKLAAKKDFYFVVAHRFASIENGIDDFFGLDQAVTQLEFIYGISDAWNVGVSRSSFQKSYAINTKYRILRQAEGASPVTLVGYNNIAINTDLDKDNLPLLEFKHRLTYVAQFLISRKMNKNLSLELAPTFFHENLVDIPSQDNSQYALGIGGRYKISNRVSINADYGYHFNRADNTPYHNPFSLGVDIETGGHVFQMHFSNAQGMLVKDYLGAAAGEWFKTIYFGFNIVRVF